MADFDRESMMEMFTYEMSQLVEQLEQNVIAGESGYSMNEINEIFRIMHTIKGSAAMMMFDNIANTAHVIEDMFYFLREKQPSSVDYNVLADLVLEGFDFIKLELNKIEEGLKADGDGSEIIARIKVFLAEMKGEPEAAAIAKQQAQASATANPDSSAAGAHEHKYQILINFEDGCEMENIRAYTLVHNLGEDFWDISHVPADVIDEDSIEEIRKNGFKVRFTSKYEYSTVEDLLLKTVYLRDLSIKEILPEEAEEPVATGSEEKATDNVASANTVNTPVGLETASETAPAIQPKPDLPDAQQNSAVSKKTAGQHMISVNVSKLDILLNLMGELVIAEAMVTQNPELEGLELESFYKETRQLRKIINDVQDTVMSMRMVPLSTTFVKMHRIVRDMCRQLQKDVQLEIIGEETEVDKNIIEHISDPLMHIIRNSVDHGIEMPDVRHTQNKPKKGIVVLEAKNSGGDVLIIVRDDGKGLNKDRIMTKAKDHGLLKKPENEYTDKEIHQFIFLPGFSTNEKVTSFSGRGVGMDVVSTNLELVGGTVSVDTVPGEGSTFVMKIPLTLAIIDGMTIKINNAKYTIPIISIKQSFKVKKENIFIDPSGNEMITLRGNVYNVIRLYNFFNLETQVTDIEEGIMIMLENGEQTICVFADELIGEQQVVVKTMPKYINKVNGISGCTLLGNGDISLIIDVAGFFDK